MGLFEQFPYTNFHEINLSWLLKTVKDLSATYGGVGSVLEEVRQAVNGNNNAIESLNYRFGKLENGDYIDNYIPALAEWIDNNLSEILSRSINFVVFGLTDDGYFYADIPDGWRDIEFGTIFDEGAEWLHLYIEYNYKEV